MANARTPPRLSPILHIRAELNPRARLLCLLNFVTLKQQLATACERLVTFVARRCKHLWNCKTVIAKRPMKRLPGYDSRTSRAELMAFCSLGLVGTALVTAAVSNAIKFAAARDDIVTALSAPGPKEQVLASANATNGLTNLIRLHSAHASDLHLVNPACSVRPHAQPM